MSQYDPDIMVGSDFGNPQAIEDSLKANNSNNSGTSKASYSEAGANWFDTTNDVMKYENNAGSDKIYATTDDLSSVLVVGEVKAFAMAPPTGWLTLDGSAISRTTYASLFSAIGTVYGVGDGSTTFNLPDAQGRALIGDGSGTGLTARTLADSSGAETHQLTESELAAHGHNVPIKFSNAAASGSTSNALDGTGANTYDVTADDTGGNTAHNNMQPYLCLRYAIYSGL